MTKEQFRTHVQLMASCAARLDESPDEPLMLHLARNNEFADHDPELGRRFDQLHADVVALFEYCRSRVSG